VVTGLAAVVVGERGEINRPCICRWSQRGDRDKREELFVGRIKPGDAAVEQGDVASAERRQQYDVA